MILEIRGKGLYLNTLQRNFIMPKLILPDEIELVRELGAGRRSQVYLANYLEHEVVVKVYKQTYVEKYQTQYGVNIGEFEYYRNQTAYVAQSLSEYIAQPYRLLLPADGYTLAFIQEYVDGIWLEDLMGQLHGLPDEVLQAGYRIVKEAAKLGLYDLDISPGNIRVQENAQGDWIPKLYDFNLMPQHLRPPNLFMALGFKLGLRSKNHRDFRSLKHWKFLGQQARQK